MQKKRSIRIISVVLILVLICVSITYVKSGNKEVLATTKKFNTENLQDNEHMHVELDNSGDKVPVPNGYVGSKATGENEIDTGYVIYEGEEEVNDSNAEEAQKTRNQYVWVPVTDIRKFYGTDENGKKRGKVYDFTTNEGNNIDETTGAMPLNWNEENGIMSLINLNGAREPEIIIKYTDNSTIYNMDSKMKTLGLEEKSSHEFLIQLEQEFNSMLESVEQYGGFYIGRYETGDLSKETVGVKKGNTDISNQTWYTMYNKCKRLSGSNTNVETGMIWGNQWDRTLMWLIESGNKTKEEICDNSNSWGNYLDSEFDYISENGKVVRKLVEKAAKIPTGSTEYTKANNIYDLAGNVTDWTLQANGINRRDYRGWNFMSKNSSSSDRYSAFAEGGHNNNGCRAMLYIK